MTVIIKRDMYTETAHRLINYDGKCAHLHGHSYKWEISLSCPSQAYLDDRGMVADYSDLKWAMQQVIEPWDHGLILHQNDPLLTILGPDWHLALAATNGKAGRVFAYPFNPTTENLAAYAYQQLEELRLKGLAPWSTKRYVKLHSVSCKETAASSCSFTSV